MSIYDFILQHSKLTEEHRDELEIKRGFSNDTIQKFKFFSGGQYLLEIEEEMISKFDRADLIKSGVFIKPPDKHSVQLSPQILENRVIVPYLDKDGHCYLLRPHKLGLSDVPVEVYQEANIDRTIIITEGEFKAAAAMQMGFSCIALPGVGSFSSKHYHRLLELLNKHNVSNITIIFDNEIKDDPAFANYKAEPDKRYDSQFYAYYMAKELHREGFSAKVGVLPDAWRKDGKIDIDGALAAGKTPDDIQRIVDDALTHTEYLKSLNDEAKKIILRKNKRRKIKSHVRKEFNHYVATRNIGGKSEYDETISNFIVKIISTHETMEGIIREVVFINEFGEQSSSFSMAPEHMTGADGFSTFCLAKGNYVWQGNKKDLSVIWEAEFLNDDGRHIIEPDHIGWVSGEKMWIFGNVAIDKDGKETRPNKNHVFWTDKKGIKPVPLGVTSGRTQISEGIPYLSLRGVRIDEIKTKLSDTIGDRESSLCLGWISAVPFLEEIFDRYGCFPFLFVTGKRGSGKSTIAEWLMNFFGLENAGKMASDTTQVGLSRYLSYYASLPVFVDEYRNTKNVTCKNGFLRNAYNRQSAGKGIKSAFGVREAKIRGTLLISGEETPEDNALLTRCVTVLVSEKCRKTNHFNWFMNNRTLFSNHILNILKRKNEILKSFMDVLEQGKTYFTENGCDDRTATNYAIVAAGYVAAFGEDLDFGQWLGEEAVRVKHEYQSENAVEVFWEELLVMKTRGMIDEKYWDVSNGMIYLYFEGLYTIFSEQYRKSRGIEPFKKASIRDYLKEEPGFESVSVNKKIQGLSKSCVVFNEKKATDRVKFLVEKRDISNAQDYSFKY